MRLRVSMKCLELNRISMIFYEVYNYYIYFKFYVTLREGKDANLSPSALIKH